MSEHRPGEGGSANTPPFPRLVPDDPADKAAERDSTLPISSDRLHVIAEGATRAEIREIPLAGANPPEEAPTSSGDSAPPEDGDDDLGDLVAGAASQVRRAGRSVNRGFQNVADQLEDLAERLESVAGLGEARGAAGLAAVARKSSGYLGDTATYFRTKDLDEARSDLEEQVRVSPLRTLLLAVGAGWIVGKIVR